MRIEVTQSDIENSVPCDGHRCPVACAIRRALPRGWNVYLSHSWGGIRRCSGGELTLFALPEDVRDFTYLFDHHCPDVKPFSFDLQLSCPSAPDGLSPETGS